MISGFSGGKRTERRIGALSGRCNNRFGFWLLLLVLYLESRVMSLAGKQCLVVLRAWPEPAHAQCHSDAEEDDHNNGLFVAKGPFVRLLL